MERTTSENRKRKEHHSETLSQSVPTARNQARKISTRASEQSRANQQAEKLDTANMQTQAAQAQSNDSLEMERLRNRDQQHLVHEQSLKEGFNIALKLIDKLQAQIKEKDAKISQMQTDNRTLKNNIDELNSEIHQKRVEKDELAGVIEGTTNDKRVSEAQVQQLDDDKMQMAEEIVEVRNEKASLRGKIWDLEDQVQKLQSDQLTLIAILNSDENAAVEQEHQRMKAEKEELVTIVETLNKDAAGLRPEHTDLHKRNTALEVDNAKLRTKIDDISAIAKLRANALNSTKTNNATQRGQIETLTKVAEGFDHEQDVLLRHIDDLNDENRQLKAENHALNEQSGYKQEKLHKQIDELNYKNLQLKEENDALQKKVDDLSRQVVEFDEAQDAAHAENAALHEKVDDLSRQVERVDIANYNAQLLEASTQQQVPRCSIGTQTPISTQRNASTQTSSHMTISDALKQIESSKQDFTQEIQQNGASEEKLRKIIFDLECDKSALQGQVQKLELEATTTKTRVAASDKEWRAEIAELKQANGSKETEKRMDEKMDVYMQWRAEVKELKEKIQDGLDSNKVLREQIGIFEDQIQDMLAERCGSVSPETPHAAWADAVSKQDTLDGQDENDNASEADTEGTLVGDYPTPGEEDPMEAASDIAIRFGQCILHPPHLNTEVEQRQFEASPVKDCCPAPDHPEINTPKHNDVGSDSAESDNAVDNYSSNDNVEPKEIENNNFDINDLKTFLARISRLYLSGLVSHNDFKMGNISAEEHQEQEAIIFHGFDTIKRTPSRDHALEMWITMKNEVQMTGDRRMQFLRESVRVMEDRNGGEEVLEEVLAKLPNARKRWRENEVVENWVERVGRVSRPQSKRRRVE